MLLAEARDRLGGRVETIQIAGGSYDLGPAWFWPGQPRMDALVRALGLQRFDQYATGAMRFEDEDGTVQQGRGYATMEGSWRLVGGLGRLVETLAKELPGDRVLLEAEVVHIALTQAGVQVRLADGRVIEADRVVLALPPRVAGQLTFEPPLPNDAVAALAKIPTWMAGQAKAIALYKRPFWCEAGLSGDAMSRCGPLVEIHDASPADTGPAALFGFIGLPPGAREDGQALKDAILAQLGRMFGPAARDAEAIVLRDWAEERFTSVKADHTPLMQHPAYGLPPELNDLWEGRLILSGSETATRFGGYLEGALEAAAFVGERIPD